MMRRVYFRYRFGVVQLVGGVEDGGRPGHGGVEARRIDSHALAGAARLIADPLEPRTRMNEGEIDVEEDGSGAGHLSNYRM